MRLVFFGTPEFAVPSLQRLLTDEQFQVVGVVTQPDKRRGRGSKTSPSPVKAIAMGAGLPVWQPRRIKKDPQTLANLREVEADVFVVVAYGQILSPEILQIPKLGCVNAHGSILPKYRGAAPIQWCLYHGETQTGITTMLMDEGMDTGPMLLKSYTPISWEDQATNLAECLANMAAELLTETLLQMRSQTIQPIPQDHTQSSAAPLIKPQDYQLDWSKSALALHNQIRAFYPHCVTNFRGETLKISGSVPLGYVPQTELPPPLARLSTADINHGKIGEIVAIAKRFGPIVQTGSGYLLISQVKLPGKRVQSGWDFVNGTRVAVGEIMG
ncbi:MAG: methionyl-tRNA formyltransferase [Arthrospira sp. SH-MAG29]|nr:methionyl-tRNA formyltransferase [Arthrospira sp. SH-MAG29]MBS0016697.1 methionyl-tRNA formyltransferase [Arthrospira sp. SH-MAG29]